MATNTPQRSYRAPCPGCGAPVEFRHAQSTHAVCAYCRSTVVRDGEVLRRIGRMAELFDDHSPLQLQARGSWEGQDFTLIGRVQYQGSTGRWTEWAALRGDGEIALLGEDNGAYVFSRRASLQREVPEAAHFRLGATTAVAGRSFTVATNDQTQVVAAEGELPGLPADGQGFASVELRNAEGEVISIDYATRPPAVWQGRTVRLEELGLSGLREEVVREERGRQFDCPQCGAAVEVTLASSKAITCAHCHSIIDLAEGTGGALRHAQQSQTVVPLIALGTRGRLQGVDWQVVGFQRRRGHDPQEPDESFAWSEYLLYNLQRGFSFLVDSEDGWSLVQPTTGAPALSANGQSATYLGSRYELRWAYEAVTEYVEGEFYWPVASGQKTSNRDFAHGRSLLSMEQTPTEITWSGGSQMESRIVADAFGLQDNARMLQRTDPTPFSASGGVGWGTMITVIVVLALAALLLRGCDDDCDPRVQNCSSTTTRSSGGSFGGWSSGGGHK